MLPSYDDRSPLWKLRLALFWVVGFAGFFLLLPIRLAWRAFHQEE